MKPVSRARSRLSVCVVLCLLPAGAFAADEVPSARKANELDAVFISAQKDRRKPEEAAPRAAILRESMDRLNVGSSEDALQFLPNLHVRKRFAGDNNGIVSVRSAGSRQSARTLVYADGLLLSNLLGSDFGYAPRWSMVQPEALESAQVLYGPFSARYPGNALGATILLTTRMPERLEGGVAMRLSRQRYTAYSHPLTSDGQQYQAWLGDRHGALSWRVALEHLNVQAQPASYYSALESTSGATAKDVPVLGAVPYRDQWGRAAYLFGINSEGVANTLNRQASLRLSYDIAPDWRATVSFGEWNQRQDKRTRSWLSDVQGNPISAGSVAVDGKRYVVPANAFAPTWTQGRRQLLSAGLQSDRSAGWNLSLLASRFATPSDISRTSGSAGAGPGQVTDGSGTGWSTFDAQASYLASADASNTLVFGLHVDRYTLQSTTQSTSDWRSGSPGALISQFRGNTRTSALFIEDTWRFLPGWSVTAGLRYERWEAFGGVRATARQSIAYAPRRNTYLSPKLSVQHAFTSAWTARLSLGKAYRMPTVSELFQGSISGTSIVNNDPGLKPELALSKDFSLERRGARGSSLRISLYEDDVRDTLFSQTDTTVFPTVTNIQNIDRVRTRGAEIAGEWRALLPGVDISTSLAWNNAITLQNRRNPASVGKRFYRIPDWRGSVVATYHFTPRLRATLAGRYSGRQYNTLDNSDSNPDTFGGTSRYRVVDLKVDAEPMQGWNIAVGVENLTGQRYFVYHPYPGRTWSLDTRFRF